MWRPGARAGRTPGGRSRRGRHERRARPTCQRPVSSRAHQEKGCCGRKPRRRGSPAPGEHEQRGPGFPRTTSPARMNRAPSISGARPRPGPHPAGRPGARLPLSTLAHETGKSARRGPRRPRAADLDSPLAGTARPAGRRQAVPGQHAPPPPGRLPPRPGWRPGAGPRSPPSGRRRASFQRPRRAAARRAARAARGSARPGGRCLLSQVDADALAPADGQVQPPGRGRRDGGEVEHAVLVPAAFPGLEGQPVRPALVIGQPGAAERRKCG